MRFALLCDDPVATPVIAALEANVDQHRLTHAVRITPRADALLHGLTNVRFDEHWEDLLIAKDIDAVIVGGNDPQILEGAKQLAASGIPMMFIPRAAQGSTFVYELSLIRDDNHVAIWPLLWHRFDRAVIQLKQALKDGELGRVQHLQLQRSLPQSSAGVQMAQSVVDEEFLHDVDLPRWLIGDYDQITALQTAATDAGVQIQSVVLAGHSHPEVNWSISSVDGPGEWKLLVHGERGVAVLKRGETSRNWIYEFNGQRTEGDLQQTAQNALAAFASYVPANGLGSTTSANLKSTHDIWGELVKCYETVDATHRSVRRRRTIELHFEPMSERAIFKTQMTAIGCSLLIATFFLTLCYLGIASLVPLPSYVLIGLRGLVFAPRVVFLFAQFLLPLARPSKAESSPDR